MADAAIEQSSPAGATNHPGLGAAFAGGSLNLSALKPASSAGITPSNTPDLSSFFGAATLPPGTILAAPILADPAQLFSTATFASSPAPLALATPNQAPVMPTPSAPLNLKNKYDQVQPATGTTITRDPSLVAACCLPKERNDSSGVAPGQSNNIDSIATHSTNKYDHVQPTGGTTIARDSSLVPACCLPKTGLESGPAPRATWSNGAPVAPANNCTEATVANSASSFAAAAPCVHSSTPPSVPAVTTLQTSSTPSFVPAPLPPAGYLATTAGLDGLLSRTAPASIFNPPNSPLQQSYSSPADPLRPIPFSAPNAQPSISQTYQSSSTVTRSSAAIPQSTSVIRSPSPGLRSASQAERDPLQKQAAAESPTATPHRGNGRATTSLPSAPRTSVPRVPNHTRQGSPRTNTRLVAPTAQNKQREMATSSPRFGTTNTATRFSARQASTQAQKTTRAPHLRARIELSRIAARSTPSRSPLLARTIVRSYDRATILRLLREVNQRQHASKFSPQTERAIRIAALVVLRKNRITPQTPALRMIVVERMQRRLLAALNRQAPRLDQKGILQDWQNSELLVKIASLERELERLEREEVERQDPRSERMRVRRARTRLRQRIRHRNKKRPRRSESSASQDKRTPSNRVPTKQATHLTPTIAAAPTPRPAQLPSRSLDLFLNKTNDGSGNEYTESNLAKPPDDSDSLADIQDFE